MAISSAALARFVFSPEERQRLHDVDDAERACVFHVLWTLKEARGKRSGEGLQPRAARMVTAQPADAANAEALGWAFGNGALALALTPGTRLERADDALGAVTHWRYASAAEEMADRD